MIYEELFSCPEYALSPNDETERRWEQAATLPDHPELQWLNHLTICRGNLIATGFRLIIDLKHDKANGFAGDFIRK